MENQLDELEKLIREYPDGLNKFDNFLKAISKGSTLAETWIKRHPYWRGWHEGWLFANYYLKPDHTRTFFKEFHLKSNITVWVYKYCYDSSD